MRTVGILPWCRSHVCRRLTLPVPASTMAKTVRIIHFGSFGQVAGFACNKKIKASNLYVTSTKYCN